MKAIDSAFRHMYLNQPKTVIDIRLIVVPHGCSNVEVKQTCSSDVHRSSHELLLVIAYLNNIFYGW